MDVETSLSVKGLAAAGGGAFEPALRGVSPLMLSEVGFVGEAPGACGARVGLQLVVHSLVNAEGSVRCEGLGALVALEGLSVRHLVLSEVVGSGEALATGRARVGGLFVVLERSKVLEPRGAQRTWLVMCTSDVC